MTFAIERLEGQTLDAGLPDLVAILIDAVDSGASVSFLPPLAPAAAAAFWAGIAADAHAGRRIVLGARLDGRLCGTVQLAPAMKPNQPHRADVEKMLVHRRARRRGIGEALMRAVEVEARALGRDLLTLDTTTGSTGDRLYRRLGYIAVGTIPGYSIDGGGRREPATFFWKSLTS